MQGGLWDQFCPRLTAQQWQGLASDSIRSQFRPESLAFLYHFISVIVTFWLVISLVPFSIYSVTPDICGCNSNCIMFKQSLVIDISLWSIQCEIVISWMPKNLMCYWAKLVQIMAGKTSLTEPVVMSYRFTIILFECMSSNYICSILL